MKLCAASCCHSSQEVLCKLVHGMAHTGVTFGTMPSLSCGTVEDCQTEQHKACGCNPRTRWCRTCSRWWRC